MAGAGLALLGFALWFRFVWAPRTVGTPRELAANWLRMGSQAAVERRFTEAVDFYARATALDPANVEAWVLLANARADAGDRAGALQAIDTAVQRAPGSPEVLLAQARVLARYRDFTASAAAARKAVAARPEDAQAQVALGLALAELTTSEETARDAREAAFAARRLGYPGPEPDVILGQVALRLGHAAEAAERFAAAVKTDPKAPALRYRLAAAYRALGRAAEAEKELQEFRRLQAATMGRAAQPSP